MRKPDPNQFIIGWNLFDWLLGGKEPPEKEDKPSTSTRQAAAMNGSVGTSWKEIHYDMRIKVVNPDGVVIADLPGWGNKSDFDDMKKQYGNVEVTGDAKSGLTQTVTVPAEHDCTTEVVFTKKGPMMCLYDAVKDYSESLLGVKLNDEDRQFFKTHPATQEDGVPFPDTLRVAQELIEPYGLRISRVQIQPNYRVNGDILQWRKVLGCNPLAYADRMTSNADFIKQLGLEGKEDPSKYRFEYTSQALWPAVACGIMYGGESSGVTGSTGGHATYIPPRRRVSGALLSFQIARASDALWRAEPTFPEYPAEAEKKVLAYDLDLWWRNHRDTKIIYGGKKSSNLPVVGEKKFLPATIGKPPCYMCNRHASIRHHTYTIPGICDDCWDHFCAKGNCEVCDGKNQTTTLPRFRLTAFHAKTRRIYMMCRQGCSKSYLLTFETGGKPVQRLIKALEEYMEKFKLDKYEVNPSKESVIPPASAPFVPNPKPDDTIPVSD